MVPQKRLLFGMIPNQLVPAIPFHSVTVSRLSAGQQMLDGSQFFQQFIFAGLHPRLHGS